MTPHGGHRCGPTGVPSRPFPTQRIESHREGVHLCWAMRPVEVLGISYEG